MYVVIDDFGCTLFESSDKEECKKFVKKEQSVECEYNNVNGLYYIEEILYEYDFLDYHKHEYNDYGECTICGDTMYPRLYDCNGE